MAFPIVPGAGAQSCVAAIDNLRMAPYTTIYCTTHYCTIPNTAMSYTVPYTTLLHLASYTEPNTTMLYLATCCTTPHWHEVTYCAKLCSALLWLDPQWLIYTVLLYSAKLFTDQCSKRLCVTLTGSTVVDMHRMYYYTVQNCSLSKTVALTGFTVVDAIAISDDSTVATASHWFLFLSLFVYFFFILFSNIQNQKYTITEKT